MQLKVANRSWSSKRRVEIRSAGNLPLLVPSPYSEGTNRDAISIFHARLRRTDNPYASILRKQFISFVQFEERTATAMNRRNEKTPEFHECSVNKDRQDSVPVREGAGFNFAVKHENVVSKVASWAEETSQEAQKRLKAHQRQRGASRPSVYKIAEQTARRLLD